MKPSRIPQTVKIGPYTYTVKLVTPVEIPGLNGDIDPNTLTIKVVRYLKRQKKREILIHEIFHGCAAIAGIYDDKLRPDDEWIEATVPTWLQVLRDNPELVAYLTS